MDFFARPLLLLCAFATVAFAANHPPVIDPPVPTPNKGVIPQFPVGKALIFPITASDPDAGDVLTYKVTSSNPRITVRVKTGNPSLRLNVSYNGGTTGQMMFLLLRDWTPLTNGFIAGFAQSGFYNNVIFHRVIKNFVVQGGDPLGTGLGGPGMTGNDPSTAFHFENEFLPGLEFTGRGQLAMANSGYASDYSGTNGSQFFITLEQLHVPTSVHQLSLDFKHTIFGQMLRGWDVLDAIANQAVDTNDKPTSNVTITSATVEPNVRDAVLMFGATGRVPASAPATITVTVSDGNGGTDTQTFTVSTVDDAANSPPVLQNLPPMTVAKNTELDFPLKHFDLEGDYVFFNHGLLSPSTSNIETSQSGPIAKILGTSDYVGPARMGFEISQFNVGQGQSESAIVQSFVPIGIGDRAVRDEPMSITATPAAQFSGVVARFQDLDPAGAPTDFTTPASNTTINWGDGSAVQNGTVAQDTTVAGPANYAVSGAHTFARAGIYTIVATMTGNNGAIGIARTQAVVSSATILPLGENLDVKGPTLANRIVATFTDSNAPGRPADYTATVDWGDGQSSKGVISLAGDKSYVVRGTHVYKDAEPFAISVKISKAGAADAFAWSTANVSGFAPVPHLPPFPLAHLTAAWNSGPTKNITAGLSSDPNGLFIDTAKLTETFTGNFVVINSGSRASPVAPLRYLLSRVPLRIANFSVAAATVITTVGAHGLATGDDVIINGVVGGTFTSTINGDFTATVINSTQFTVPVTCASAVVTSPGSIFSRTAATDGATPLSVNKVAALQVASFAPGAGGSGNFTIALPKGVSPAGRYLLAQLVYSDPIIDASKVDKVVVSGPFNGVHVYNQGSDSGTSSSGALQTTQKGGKAHFSVVLEAQPTANVTIALTSSNTAEGTVSPASLTFTTANWNRAQTVTVTGVGGSTASGDQSYTVTVQSPVSTDPRYSGAAADTISLVNVHNG